MAKLITLNEKAKQDIMEEFAEYLKTARLADGQFVFKKSFGSSKQNGKASVLYTPAAYVKMLKLLEAFTSEVAWHGLVKRTADDEFVVYDIISYPQVVTNVTVDTDQDEYTDFLTGLPMDQAQHMHMQAHSHVNMGVNPSGVDKQNQADIIGSMRRKGFYIFQIWNKRLECHSTIYDFDQNILYENADVTVDIVDDDGNYISDFISVAKRMVKHSNVTTAGKGNTYGGSGYGNYGGYGSYGGSYGSYGNSVGRAQQFSEGTPEKKEKSAVVKKDGAEVEPEDSDDLGELTPEEIAYCKQWSDYIHYM